MKHDQLVQELSDELGITAPVANELLLLAGDNCELVKDCSYASSSVRECKARIVNERFGKIEEPER